MLVTTLEIKDLKDFIVSARGHFLKMSAREDDIQSRISLKHTHKTLEKPIYFAHFPS